jgi:integrase
MYFIMVHFNGITAAKAPLTNWLPYLSAYMGHSEFSSTAYYIHLLPERLVKASTIEWARFSELIPEVAL